MGYNSYISQYCIDTGTYTPPGVDDVGPQLSGGYNCVYGTTGINYLNVSNNASEIALFNSWWQEQISQFGQQVNYYINGFNLSAMDYLYGEMPLVQYAPPIPMIMALTISNDNAILSKFGLQGQADLTAVVSIATFTNTVTAISGSLSAANYEPKAGDLIELSQYGSTRPNGRSGQVYEITERLDQSGGDESNQLLGHYIWTIKAKRFDFNYELEAPREKLMDQVYDNKTDGLVNNLPKIIETKEYTQFVDKVSETVFDYTQNSQANTSVYGDYVDNNTLVNLVGVSNTRGQTTGALGASASTYVVLESPSNYATSTASAVASANTIALYNLYTILSAFNPALSALAPILPSSESSTEAARSPAPINYTNVYALLSALGIIPPPGP